MVYGGRDAVFEVGSLDYKAVYYTYKEEKKLDEQYENGLKEKF